MSQNAGRRIINQYDVSNPEHLLDQAREAFRLKDYFTAYDIYEQLASAFPAQSVDILSELYDAYHSLPDATSRYWLYQGRHFNFNIRSDEKVLDIGSGNIPFPFATHLADLAIKDDTYGRAGVPFKYLDGKPVYECDVENMPFSDKEFDFVYCSHVLEHTHNPEKACKELVRIAKRGYIETPTRGKDLFLHTGKVSNHTYFVENLDGTLIFTEYTAEELEGLSNDILLQMHVKPQTKREKAFSALIYLKSHLINTMLYWENDFPVQVRKRNPVSVSKKVTVHSSNSKEKEEFSAVFVNMYYPAFLQEHYQRYPNLINAPYAIQHDSLISARFGDSDFYSRNLSRQGWRTKDLIINAAPLQSAWAKEHQYNNVNGLDLFITQIIHEKPDIIYFHDLSIATKEVIHALRPHVSLIVGQIACPLFENTYYKGFDIIISSLPHFVEKFRAMGITSYYQPLAFEPLVCDNPTEFRERPIQCSFVGGLSSIHTNSLQLLESLAERSVCEFWGYGAESLPSTSPIRKKHQGEVWGIDMFRTLQNSQITINRHGAFAEDYANNMRLFEATGSGALLITDNKSNIGELFEPNKEIITYSSVEECIELVRYYSNHPEEAAIIAEAGRKRTLKDHTYSLRMEQLSVWLTRHLRYSKEKFSDSDTTFQNASTKYENITVEEVTENLLHGWENASIPKKQRHLVQQELLSMYKGSIPRLYSVAAESVKPYIQDKTSLLEVGCSSGYYSEVLEYLTNKEIQYTGVDISEAFIKMAKDYYPHKAFIQAPASSLPLKSQKFDIVFSAGVVLYELDYVSHIKEMDRVAKDVLIFHRTPVTINTPTQLQKKHAYGVETIEYIFNEKEFLDTVISLGWTLTKTIIVSSNNNDCYDKTYTFLRNQSPSSSEQQSYKNTMTMEGTPPFAANVQPEEILKQRAYSFTNEGIALFQQSKFEEALVQFDEAIINYPQVPNLQYLRSLCLWRLGRIDESFVAMYGELKVSPHNEQALYAASMASRAIKPYIEFSSAYIAEIQQQKEMLRKFEFKIFSQSGEDGILMGIFSRVGTTNKKFMEIGIGNGDECNTANLSINHGWSGLLVDGDDQQVINARNFYKNYSGVSVAQCFVTTDNINDLLIQNRMTGEIDLMSLDIDGNDYWVLEKVNVLNPRVVVLEYNPTFGPERSITVPYDPNFYRMNYHSSGYYHGASLTALTKLMKKRGYSLVGCDSNGYNAFYVREDVAEGIMVEIPPAKAYYPAKPRFRAGSPDIQFSVIKDLQFVEV